MSCSMRPMLIGNREVYVEIEQYGEEEVTAANRVLSQVENAFEAVQYTIINVSKSIVSAIDELGEKGAPDEFKIEFSLKIGAEGQIILTKMAGEAQLAITLVHRRKPAAP